MAKSEFCLGIDGGGTKTDCVFADVDGKVICTRAYAALNPNGADRNVFTALLDKLLDDALARDGKCVSVCVGMAGYSNVVMRTLLAERIQERLMPQKLTVMGDHELTLYAGTCAEETPNVGAALISGTGSICFGKDGKGNEFRAGGWGYLLGDEGSGYGIGRDVLSHALCACDGRETGGALYNAVCAELGIDSCDRLAVSKAILALAYLGKAPRTQIAKFAKLLSPALAAGDTAARRILTNAANGLSDIASAVVNALSLENGKLTLAGSVLLKNDDVCGAVKAALREKHPMLTVERLRITPAEGAAIFAARAI